MDYPLYREGQQLGKLQLQELGIRCCLQADCPRQPGLCRAWAVGERGRLLIGVMEPRGESLYACRVLSRSQMQALGPLLRGEVLMEQGEGEWKALLPGEGFFSAGHFPQALPLLTGALWKSGQRGRFLALPYDGRGPFPLEELFCFASLRCIGGKRYAVFLFDPGDFPLFC